MESEGVMEITDEYLKKKYPVYMAGHSRMEDIHLISDFLDWMGDEGLMIYENREVELEEWDHENKEYYLTGETEEQRVMITRSRGDLIAMFFGLDPEEYRTQQEAARQEILDAHRCKEEGRDKARASRET